MFWLSGPSQLIVVLVVFQSIYESYDVSGVFKWACDIFFVKIIKMPLGRDAPFLNAQFDMLRITTDSKIEFRAKTFNHLKS